MRKIFLGIDISKEKLNICLMKDLKIVHEDEIGNSISSIKKMLKRVLSGLCDDDGQLLVCAEFTGKYIYPLACTCHEMGVSLWMEDPTRIKHSFGLSRGKNDVVDARRIAEYANRNSDKAVTYTLPEKEMSSIKMLLNDREMLLADKKKYQMQIADQKGFMSKEDYAIHCKVRKAIVSAIEKQIESIEIKIEELASSSELITHQTELLKSIDGIGKWIALYMVITTNGFIRFENARQFNCYAGLAPFVYTSGKSIHSKAKVSQRANKQLKALLHMAALCAATHMKSGEYKEYYERRCSEGKHPMCVLNIVRAKLVSRMFAVIRRDEKYSRNYVRQISGEKNLSTPLYNS